MKNDYETILNRKGNGSMKWERAYIKKRFKVDSEDVYPLFIADMDFKMDKAIYSEFQEIVKEPDFGYFHIQDSFYESILEWHQKVHGLTIHKEWILPSIGTITSLHMASDLLVRGKGMLAMTPVYGSFKSCLEIGKPCYLPLLEKASRFFIDYEGLETKLKTDDIKAILFCNPHNPGGRLWSYEELKRLVLLCKKYDVLLLSDEIHSDLLLTGERFVSVMEFCDLYDGIITATSPNKTFNISGLSGSYLLCVNASIREQIEAYMQRLHLSSNRIAIEMMEICYRNGYQRLQELKAIIQQHMQMVKQMLQDLDVDIMEPEAGYLVWIKLPKIENVDDFVLALAKQTHVLVETGSRFIQNYEQHIRINVATSTTLLQKALTLFHDFYKDYQA